MPPMAGLTLQSLKRHTALIPLFVIIGAGVVGAAGYLTRLAVKNPDVCWDKKNNPNPNEEYAGRQYKFYNANKREYVDPRPKF